MFNVDTRWIFPQKLSGPDAEIKDAGSYVDAWGISRKRPKTSFYYDMTSAPLAQASVEDIKQHAWPKPAIAEDLEEDIAQLAKRDFAIFTSLAGVFEQATYVRGMENFYTDIYNDLRLFEALLDKILEVELAQYEKYFSIAGKYLDVIEFWGDLGSQQGPLIAPKHYKQYIKPREAALVEFAKKHTNAKIALHTCGASYEFMPDILDAGYDILNPIQTTAAGMDPVRLKQEFGKDIVFWGAIDTQRVLPFGTKDEVKQEVHNQIQALATGGGYILAPCHNIQALTPAENVITMFQAALEFGTYPIQDDQISALWV
jgi:uroporphyrinogen decarboxylase